MGWGGGLSPAVNPAFVSLPHFVFLPHFTFYHSFAFHLSLNTQKIQFTLKNAINSSLRAFIRKFSVSSSRDLTKSNRGNPQKRLSLRQLYLVILSRRRRIFLILRDFATLGMTIRHSLAMTRIFIKNSTHFILFTQNFRAVCTDKFDRKEELWQQQAQKAGQERSRR